MDFQSKSYSKPEPQTIFNDVDNYNPPMVSPERLAQFKTMDSDEDNLSAYTIAFGNTISMGDYMDQYKKHNRANSKMSGLVSPSVHKNTHVHFLDTNLKPKLSERHSNKSVGTLNAMTQAARYYSDLHHQEDNTNTDTIQTDNHSVTNFKVMSTYSAMNDNFESKTLEYGQDALFDRINKQYYADLQHGQRRHVLVNLHVNRITEIDTVKESFRCQFWVSFSWLPTYYEWLDYKEHQSSNNLIDWKPSWIPIITFPEVMHQWKLHFAERPNSGQFQLSLLNGKDDDIGYDPKYCKFIRCKLECDMTFSTGFLLLNFPVDCQDLPISMNEISGGCTFVAEKRKRSFASIHTISSVMEEWEFLNMIIEIGELLTGNESSLAQLKVRLKMQRRYEVYLWNVVFFMALISGLTLCSFAVEEVDLGERLAIIITLLLTSVAYQSNVFITLPNVPYLTLLDKYIVTSFVFMTMVTIETAILASANYLDNDINNKVVFMVSAIAFVGYHIVFFWLAKNKKMYEISKLYMPSKTMMELYHQSRERMEVDWKSEIRIGSNWKIYTKYPERLIITETPTKF